MSATKNHHAWLLAAMAILLALFGDICSFLSRIQAPGASEEHLWMMAIGIAAGCLIGTGILKTLSRGLSKSTFMGLHLVVLAVVAIAMTLRILVGPLVSFAVVYLLLGAGMVYQVAAWIMLSHAATEAGAPKTLALGVGWVFYALNVVGGDRITNALVASGAGTLSLMVAGLIGLLVIGCMATALIPQRIWWPQGKRSSQVITHAAADDSGNAMARNAEGDTDAVYSPAVFTDARNAYEDALAQRLGVVAAQYGLSPREAETLLHLAHGLTMNQVAEKMFITPGTAKSHAVRLYRKLNVGSKQDAVALLRES